MKNLLKVPVAVLSLMALTTIGCASSNTGLRPVTPPRTSTVGTTAPTEPEIVTGARRGSIPVGQEMDVRLRTSLSSETTTVEQRFETTTVVDLMQDGRVLVPAGTLIEGVVSDVDKAGRIDRNGHLTLTFDRMNVNGRTHDIRASATQIFESGGVREEIGTAGVGAGVGGVVGGLLGGLKGAIIGAAIGAGGAIAATDGKDISLPAGAIVRIRMDSPVTVG